MENFISNPFFLTSLFALLIFAILGGVHFAEKIACRVGEPFGSLILAICITIIEVALIVSMMLSGIDGSEFIARDTVFAAVMIIGNGVIGLCIFLGGLRYRELAFKSAGTLTALAVLVVLITFSLVLPIFTVSTSGPTFSTSQLIFAGVSSLVLYCAFIAFQTITHREYFSIPPKKIKSKISILNPNNSLIANGVQLFFLLLLVVFLAKLLSPTIEDWVLRVDAPKTMVGIIIAAIVLLPEGVAAVRAARENRLQSSINLALGSAIASIGLTIPAVAAISIYFNLPMSLGIPPLSMLLLFLSVFIGLITLSLGKTNVLQGAIHLIIFFTYLFTTMVG
jgi:Ca2+:H+ antiporter